MHTTRWPRAQRRWLHRRTPTLPVALIGVVAAAAVLLAACGGNDSGGGSTGASDSAGPVKKVTLRMNFSPVGDQAYYYFAQQQGYFKQNGLDVDIQDGKGSLQTAQDVAGGGATIGLTASISAATAIAKGADLISVANPVARSSWGLVVPKNSDIHSIKDVTGHKILVSAGSPETVFLPAAFSRNSVNPSAVTERNVDPAAKFSAYLQKLGDAVGTSVTSIVPLMQEKRPSRGVLFADNGVPFPDYSIVVRRSTLSRDQDMIAGFLRAVFRAQQDAIKDPARVAAALVKARPGQGSAALYEAQLKYAKDFYCTASQAGKPYGYQVPGDWSAALDTLKRFGGVSGDLDTKRFITNEFFTGSGAVSKARCAGA